MQNPEDFFDFSGQPSAIRLKGHRIGIEHVLEIYKDGRSAEEIAATFPSLRLEDVYASILYYLLHRPSIDAYLRDYEELGQRMMAQADSQPSPAGARLRELWKARQGEKRGENAVSPR
jgi:uncharacterized protein (DUF433 family)